MGSSLKVALVGDFHQDGINILEKNNIICEKVFDYSKENMIDKLKDAHGIGIRTIPLFSDILSKCNHLKIVGRHGVGYDSVDLKYLNENKIPLAITGTSNAVSVAEHVLMMFLSSARRTIFADKLVKDGKFSDKTLVKNTYELFQKNILIIGFGRIGKALAKRCLAFEAKVFVYDPFVEKTVIEESQCHYIDFKEGLSLADFITLHLPLSEKTMNLISHNEFNLMKKNCILVNTSRGGIVNQDALINALNNKLIFAAGLDVFLPEPPEKNDPILVTENLIFSPHNSALTLEGRKRMSVETIENIVSHLNGNTNVANIVNKDIL